MQVFFELLNENIDDMICNTNTCCCMLHNYQLQYVHVWHNCHQSHTWWWTSIYTCTHKSLSASHWWLFTTKAYFRMQLFIHVSTILSISLAHSHGFKALMFNHIQRILVIRLYMQPYSRCLLLPCPYGSGHETVAALLPGFAINW